MNYSELCVALEGELGQAPVFDNRHPELGARTADQAEFVLWVHDDTFDVGGVERGEFKTVYRFATEAEACEYILGALKRNANVSPESDAERQHSETVTEKFTDTLLNEFNARRD